MKQKTFEQIRVQIKGDTEENLQKATGFVPLDRELVVRKSDDKYKYPRFRLGDGQTNVNDLPILNEQPDWNQEDVTAADYIKNKPKVLFPAKEGTTLATTEDVEQVVEIIDNTYAQTKEELEIVSSKVNALEGSFIHYKNIDLHTDQTYSVPPNSLPKCLVTSWKQDFILKQGFAIDAFEADTTGLSEDREYSHSVTRINAGGLDHDYTVVTKLNLSAPKTNSATIEGTIFKIPEGYYRIMINTLSYSTSGWTDEEYFSYEILGDTYLYNACQAFVHGPANVIMHAKFIPKRGELTNVQILYSVDWIPDIDDIPPQVTSQEVWRSTPNSVQSKGYEERFDDYGMIYPYPFVLSSIQFPEECNYDEIDFIRKRGRYRWLSVSVRRPRLVAELQNVSWYAIPKYEFEQSYGNTQVGLAYLSDFHNFWRGEPLDAKKHIGCFISNKGKNEHWIGFPPGTSLEEVESILHDKILWFKCLDSENYEDDLTGVLPDSPALDLHYLGYDDYGSELRFDGTGESTVTITYATKS